MEKQVTVKKNSFEFKQFSINQENCAMKIGTDGVLLGAWFDASNADNILDIGTGTGVIAIMAGQRNQNAKVHAVEIEEKAFGQAQQNMQAAKWNDRLEVFHNSIQDYCKSCKDKYDVILSNPPFFSGGTLSANNERNDFRHTVKLPNGDLLRAAQALLSPTGKFCVILPFMEGLRFKERAASYKLFCTRMTKVKSVADGRTERVLLQFELTDKPIVEDKLTIAAKEREFTDEYVNLTKDFYLKM